MFTIGVKSSFCIECTFVYRAFFQISLFSFGPASDGALSSVFPRTIKLFRRYFAIFDYSFIGIALLDTSKFDCVVFMRVPVP